MAIRKTMRKKYIKEGLTEEYIESYINKIYNFFYVNIPEKNKIDYLIKKNTVDNKVMQSVLYFNIFYKNFCLYSLTFPYNSHYVKNFTEEEAVYIIFQYLYKYLPKQKLSISEQEFILDNYKLIDNNLDKTIQNLKNYKKFFDKILLDRIDAIILLHKLL